MIKTVTCTCGEVQEVIITKSDAATLLGKFRKPHSTENLKKWGEKGAKKRWEGHVKLKLKTEGAVIEKLIMDKKV